MISVKKTLPLATVVAFLRLGRKYEIEHLWVEAMTRLTHDYPSTLEHLDRAVNVDLIESYPGKSTDIVQLALDHNIPSILPAALVFCSILYDTEHFLEGRRRPDGSVVILSANYRHACMMGRDRLFELQAAETFKWLNVTSDGDSDSCSKDLCAFTRRRIFQEIWFPFPDCLVLSPWNQSWEEGMCKGCIDSSIQEHRMGRENIWRMLPSIFGLAPWEELLRE